VQLDLARSDLVQLEVSKHTIIGKVSKNRLNVDLHWCFVVQGQSCLLVIQLNCEHVAVAERAEDVTQIDQLESRLHPVLSLHFSSRREDAHRPDHWSSEVDRTGAVRVERREGSFLGHLLVLRRLLFEFGSVNDTLQSFSVEPALD